VVLASANPDKVAELAELLGERFDVRSRPADLPETIEDQDSLEGNAIKKASEVAEATGEWALADDTGLFVDVLGGSPGVHTARFAGPDATYDENVDKLIDSLAEVAEDDRTASFRTVVALIGPDGTGLTAEGSVDGYITAGRSGEGGFGYDPIFEPAEGDGRTFSQMSRDEKHELSHRSRALAALETALARNPLTNLPR
jgi:XTP/dITP diphosphohydrolase